MSAGMAVPPLALPVHVLCMSSHSVLVWVLRAALVHGFAWEGLHPPWALPDRSARGGHPKYPFKGQHSTRLGAMIQGGGCVLRGRCGYGEPVRGAASHSWQPVTWGMEPLC